MVAATARERQSRELEDGARAVLLDFFASGDDFTVKDMGRARIAASALSTCAREKQAQRAEEAMRLRIGIELSENRDQLSKYVHLTMPQYSVAKALPGKSEASEAA